MHDIHTSLNNPSAFQSAGCHPHAIAIFQSAHEHTWATTQGLEAPATLNNGLKAGDPYSDLIFGFIMARVLAIVHVKLEAAGYKSHIVEAAPSIFAPCGAPLAQRSITSNYVDLALPALP